MTRQKSARLPAEEVARVAGWSTVLPRHRKPERRERQLAFALPEAEAVA